MIIGVSPATGPVSGDMLVTVGSATYVYLFPVTDVPFGVLTLT